MSLTTTPGAPSRWTDRVLAGIERAGNKLPHPVYLFLGLLVIIGVASTLLALGGATVTVPGRDEMLAVQGLFTPGGMTWWMQNAVANFAGFPPIATVLMLVMAVGVAERSRMLDIAIRLTIGRAPAWALPYLVAFVALQGHMMSDASFLLIPPLAAVAFRAAGRHPVAGLLGSFACVSAGYASGFTIGSIDALYSGISQRAVAVLPGVEVPTHILVNYFFTASSSLVLAALGGWLIQRVLEPKLPPIDASAPDATAGADGEDAATTAVSTRERTALWVALGAGAAYLALVLVLWTLPGSPLQGPGGSLVPSPVLSSVPVLLFVGLTLAGVVFGFTARTFTRGQDVPAAMGAALVPMTGYIVLMFVVAQVTAIFTWSNVGTLMAVNSAAALDSIGLGGLPLLLLFVLLVCLLNLFIVSGSALWSLLAPVFVPTFLLLGLQPAVALAAFRIGDSATALITPMNVYLFVVLAMLQRYEPQARFGTLISRMVTFMVPFIAVWTVVLVVFYLADLPLGPGAGIHMP
jgi:aminobenzoyl-glutamate transport protein